jgi:hypothetical protein
LNNTHEIVPNTIRVEAARIGSKTNKPIDMMSNKDKSEISIAAVPSTPIVTVVTPVVSAKSNSCEDFDLMLSNGPWIARENNLVVSADALKLKKYRIFREK